MSGHCDSYKEVAAYSDENLKSQFDFNISIHQSNFICGSSEVDNSINGLSPSKSGPALALRYLKKGVNPASIQKFNQAKLIHEKLLSEFEDMFIFSGGLIHHLRSTLHRHHYVHSHLHLSINVRFPKIGYGYFGSAVRVKGSMNPNNHYKTIYAERALEIKNGKSATKSCTHCGHRFDTSKIDALNVIYCKECGKTNPFNSASFDKKVASLNKKIESFKVKLQKSYEKILKLSPYLYHIEHAYRDDEGECYCED